MTHIVTLDGDGQHRPEDFRAFLPVIDEEPNAIVVGTRSFNRDTPVLSRFGRQFSNFWLRLQTGAVVHDTQSGFRAYPVALLRNLALHEKGYSFEVEVLAKAAWAGVPIREVSVHVSYPPKTERVSHFSLIRDNLRLTVLNTRLTVRALLPLPHGRISGGEKSDTITIVHPLRSLTFLLKENLFPRPLALAGALGVFLGPCL